MSDISNQLYSFLKYVIDFHSIFIILISFNIFLFIFRVFISNLLVNILKNLFFKLKLSITDDSLRCYIPPLKNLPILIFISLINFHYYVNSIFWRFIENLNYSIFYVFIFWFIYQSIYPISNFLKRYKEKLTESVLLWIIKIIKFSIVFLCTTAILELWGIRIIPIIAGFGLFGIAIALGAQDLFKNLISGLMILIEKGFKVGDSINISGYTQGTVEHIGLRSTLIRKFDSTPILIPNYAFTEASIMNYSNRPYRRINWFIALEYSSTVEQIKSLNDYIKIYINDSQDFVINDNFKSIIRIDKFNDSSIDILLCCFTSTNDWEKFLEIKEKLEIEIKNKLEKLNIKFAFPSQSVYLEKN